MFLCRICRSTIDAYRIHYFYEVKQIQLFNLKAIPLPLLLSLGLGSQAFTSELVTDMVLFVAAGEEGGGGVRHWAPVPAPDESQEQYSVGSPLVSVKIPTSYV